MRWEALGCVSELFALGKDDLLKQIWSWPQTLVALTHQRESVCSVHQEGLEAVWEFLVNGSIVREIHWGAGDLVVMESAHVYREAHQIVKHFLGVQNFQSVQEAH
jgi:hypothetical protein